MFLLYFFKESILVYSLGITIADIFRGLILLCLIQDALSLCVFLFSSELFIFLGNGHFLKPGLN